MNLLPYDLLKSALKQGQYSVLIKGKPGTGKTTLVLTLMRELMSDAIYISTRINKDELIKQFPWIATSVGSECIIDARQTRIVRPLEDVLTYTSVDQFMKKIFDLAKQYKNRRLTIIIDSIDAIRDYLGSDERSCQLERLFIELSDIYKYNIIFVSESYKITKLDYLADAIFYLKEIYIDGRIIRELIIKKFRGMKVSPASFVFTITNQGIEFAEKAHDIEKGLALLPFFHFSKIEEKKETELVRFYNYSNFKMTPDPDPFCISSGIPQFDKLIGGKIPSKTSIFIDIDEHIPSPYFVSFLDAFGLNAIHQNRPWFIIPIIAGKISVFYNKVAKETKLDLANLLRFIVIGSSPMEAADFPEASKICYFWKKTKTLIDFFDFLRNVVFSNYDNTKTGILTASITALSLLFENDDALVHGITKIIEVLRNYNVIGIFFAGPNIATHKRLSALFQMVVKFKMYKGTPLLSVDKPIHTPYHIYMLKARDGFPEIVLKELS